jgi:hypothetical protein
MDALGQIDLDGKAVKKTVAVFELSDGIVGLGVSAKSIDGFRIHHSPLKKRPSIANLN